jgi:hypothetical protein
VDVIAIYEVESGKIAKAWFKMGPPRLRPATAFSPRPANADDAGAIRSLTVNGVIAGYRADLFRKADKI